MTMRDAVWMADLLRRVPVRVVDVAAARKAGDVAALAYHRAITEWLAEAALALTEADLLDGSAQHDGGASDVGASRGDGPVGKFRPHLISNFSSDGDQIERLGS